MLLTCAGTVGTDGGPATLFGIGNTNPFRPPTGDPALGSPDDATGLRHHGLVTFAGGQPVYRKPGGTCGTGAGVLLGAVGVSGEGVDQDDAVAMDAVTNGGFCFTP